MESFDKKATYLLIAITLFFVVMLLTEKDLKRLFPVIGTGGFK